MNSKIIIALIALPILSGCGVKADPVKFPETAIDSYVQGYTGSEPTAEELERTKSKTEKVPPLIPAP